MFMRKSVSLFLAAVALAAVPGRADASLILYAQQEGVNGGAVTELLAAPDFGEGVITATYGDFRLTIFGARSANDPDLSSLLSAAVSIENNSASTETIALYVSQDNYSLPGGTPLLVESGLSGTVNRGTLEGFGTFQAFLDADNQLLGLDDFTVGPQDAVFTGSTFDTGSATGLFDRDGLYSITSLAKFTVSGGGEGNFSSHVNVMATPIPEQATIALALTGLPVVGLVAWRRRKRIA